MKIVYVDASQSVVSTEYVTPSDYRISTLYFVIVAPLLEGALQEILTLVPELTTVGAFIVELAELAAIGTMYEYPPHPYLFFALNLKLYVTP